MTALLEQTRVINGDLLHTKRIDLGMYDRMIEFGVIDNESRVELLDGILMELEEMKPPHMFRVKRMYDRVLKQFEGRSVTLNQSPIELPSDGRPQPDIALLRSDFPEDQYAQPEDVLLVVEVAETTLTRDREFKSFIYARDGIPEYWIVNLKTNRLEIYRDPTSQGFKTTFQIDAGQSQTCLAFPNDPIDWS
jgi:Uma2 family endonuclease